MKINKEKVILISFFKSENLGDEKLSKELLEIIENKYRLVSTYDFSSMSKINTNQESQFRKTEIKQKKIKNILKKAFRYFIGKRTYQWIGYHYKVKGNINVNLFKEIKHCDRVIIGGGNMLMDKDKTWPLRKKKIIDFCYLNNIKVDIVYVGAGPISRKLTKRIYKEIFDKVQVLMVRDHLSKSLLMPYTSKNINIEFDPALVYDEKKYIERFNNIERSNKNVLGINVLGEECFASESSNNKYLKNINALINFIDDEELEEIILFSTAKNDYKNISKLMHSINKYKVTVKKISDYEDIVNLYSKLTFLIGGRMHSLIFAQSMYLPYIALVWDNKVYGFLEMIDNDFLAIDIENVTNDFNLIKASIFNNSNNISILEKMKKRNIHINKSRKYKNIE